MTVTISRSRIAWSCALARSFRNESIYLSWLQCGHRRALNIFSSASFPKILKTKWQVRMLVNNWISDSVTVWNATFRSDPLCIFGPFLDNPEGCKFWPLFGHLIFSNKKLFSAKVACSLNVESIETSISELFITLIIPTSISASSKTIFVKVVLRVVSYRCKRFSVYMRIYTIVVCWWFVFFTFVL